MNFNDYKIKTITDIAIVTVDLLVATQRDAKPFWDQLENDLVLKWDKVIIDLSYCTLIDSTFVGMIVKIFKTVSSNNGQLKLVYPEKNARTYLHTTGIVRIIDCFNTLNEAVNSFDSKIPTRKISFDEELLYN
ncbi:MAG: STAS domain-containing protein [Ignavibacteriaceae bacterium]|jgi:stage II sporulation protein AA (anti-sigma F factor antagonist)|nr:STAS domain-containing protein [Ignavibacteriaceae bacterium]